MKRNIRVLAVVSIAVLLLAGFFFGLPSNNFMAAIISAPSNQLTFIQREEAYRANNLGVARLEQYNPEEAVKEFRRALQIDPKMAIARVNLAIGLFNAQETQEAFKEAKTATQLNPEILQPIYLLGLIAKSEGRVDESATFFQRVLETDVKDVGANVNLGQIYIQKRNYEKATIFLRRAVEAEPYNSTAIYNLATALLRTDARDEGKELMLRFQALRESGAATSIGQKYLEQGRYAEAIVSTGAESELVDKAAPKVTFRESTFGLPPAVQVENDVEKSLDNTLYSHAAALFDLENDGDLDLVKIDNHTVSLYRNDQSKFSDVTKMSGALNNPLGLKGSGVVAGDFDNDNDADLLIFGYGQASLFRNNGKGLFENVTESAKIPATSVASISGAFIDADHDGDLDIFLGGFSDNAKEENEPAANILLRNDGDGTFSDISETAKIDFPSRAVAVVPTDFDNRRDIDILVLNQGGKAQLYRNLRDGSFEDVAEEVGLRVIGNWTSAAAGDFNKDDYTDFYFGKADGIGVFAVSDGKGNFVMKDAPTESEKTSSAQFFDYDNDGLLDLIVNTDKGFVVTRNLGDGWSKAEDSTFESSAGLENSSQILSGDIDNDGDIDLLAFRTNGSLGYLKNVGGNTNRSEIFNLQGRVSNRTGIGAKVEMRAGSLAQKLESYSASPAPAPAQIHFGLGKREKPDAVRVIWTSGVVQAETDFSSESKNHMARNFSVKNIEELDRKPSSCPYLYTWNGEKFEFITDFLGGGEMGNWQEAGVYHYPDSDEFVRITSDQLKPKNGKYEIRVTNELEEVMFLDHVKLYAVEHDADRNVYPNEGLGIPSAGKEFLYTTQNERAPISAKDTDGIDILPKIQKIDRSFYDNFRSQNVRGYAETHNLTLKLDNKSEFNGRTLLLLTGWTDYAFSSDNLAASQSGRSLFLPKLQVKNEKGDWQTVIESIGISVGRPQTIVVDLTGKFLTNSRDVRIVTNFKTYWDKIAVDTSKQDNVKKIELKALQADLRERGFSEEIKYGEMITTNYDKVFDDGRWKYFPGNFTKTGAVNELLDKVDDVFVVSKTGDEFVLNFKALPTLPKNRKYTFLLYADGYSKEMDINSGSPDAVFPFPFKAMKKYPYGNDERYPMTSEKRRIYNKYMTRSVRAFLPSLESYLIE